MFETLLEYLLKVEESETSWDAIGKNMYGKAWADVQKTRAEGEQARSAQRSKQDIDFEENKAKNDKWTHNIGKISNDVVDAIENLNAAINEEHYTDENDINNVIAAILLGIKDKADVKELLAIYDVNKSNIKVDIDKGKVRNAVSNLVSTLLKHEHRGIFEPQILYEALSIILTNVKANESLFIKIKKALGL